MGMRELAAEFATARSPSGIPQGGAGLAEIRRLMPHRQRLAGAKPVPGRPPKGFAALALPAGALSSP